MKSNLALKDQYYSFDSRSVKTESKSDGIHINYKSKKSKVNIKEIREIVGIGFVVGVFMLGFMYVLLNLDKFCTIYR